MGKMTLLDLDKGIEGAYKFKITDAADNIIRVINNVTAFINTLPPAPVPPPTLAPPSPVIPA